MPMLDVGGSALYYRVKGEGIPIVFIHPPVLTSLNFTYQAEELSNIFKSSPLTLEVMEEVSIQENLLLIHLLQMI